MQKNNNVALNPFENLIAEALKKEGELFEPSNTSWLLETIALCKKIIYDEQEK
jgi:hypothetical protein